MMWSLTVWDSLTPRLCQSCETVSQTCHSVSRCGRILYKNLAAVWESCHCVCALSLCQTLFQTKIKPLHPGSDVNNVNETCSSCTSPPLADVHLGQLSSSVLLPRDPLKTKTSPRGKRVQQGRAGNGESPHWTAPLNSNFFLTIRDVKYFCVD